MCEMMPTEKELVVTCSRDPIIKILDLSQKEDGPLSEYKGHTMSVTAVSC